MSAPDRFSCDEVFQRLDDWLDRELSPDEMARVREHLETCAVCAEEYVFEANVLRVVRDKLGRIDAPRDLLDRIRRTLDAEAGA